MKRILTIAGSDPSGGAGVQADIRAFNDLGLEGATAMTAVTVQSPAKFDSVNPVDAELVRAQIEAVLAEGVPDAVKTGLLYSVATVDACADVLDGKDVPLVVDPVLSASAGQKLSESGLVKAMKERLFPLATIITPNVPEAEELLGRTISEDEIEEACRELHALGPRFVLLKGGHLEGDEAVDYLYDGGEMREFHGERLARGMHGSGCTLSAYVAGYLALGLDVQEAVRRAKTNTFRLMAARGIQPAPVEREMADAVWRAAKQLEGVLTPAFIPEVGINIGYAMEGARGPEDVCALEGRIVRCGDGARVVGMARFGASKHVARIVLAAIERDLNVRAVVNVKYSERNLEACRDAGLSISSFSRDDEPPEGSSMDWGTRKAMEGFGGVPDVIYDVGGFGKEPMIRVLGLEPDDVVRKVRNIISEARL